MNIKNVEAVFTPPPTHFVGDGFRVHNFIPGVPILSMRRMDPFIMMDYNSLISFAPSIKPRGVGVHPHKGFETVTISYKGKVQHHDSWGGGGIIGEGDVQWMTAASGILHKEYHEKEFSKHGGDFQMVQLWVNLPKKFKNTEPKYQPILNKDIPKISSQDVTIDIIAGNFEGINGAASTFSPIIMLNVSMKKGSKKVFTLPADFNTALLVIEGNLSINENIHVDTDNLALFLNDGENFTLKANSEVKLLILSGQPLNEPIAAYGPFVMNSKEEILQAYREFNEGKYGFLED